MRRIAILVLLLAGCREGAEMGGGDADDPCGAAGYAGMVGTNVAAVTLPADLDHRIVGPDDAVTMDFVETRLNFRTDADGVIVAVTCG